MSLPPTLGSAFSLTELSAPALALSETLTEAIRAQVLEDDGARLRFRHDLIRDAIYTDLPGSRPAADWPGSRAGQLADIPGRGRFSRTRACGPGSA